VAYGPSRVLAHALQGDDQRVAHRRRLIGGSGDSTGMLIANVTVFGNAVAETLDVAAFAMAAFGVGSFAAEYENVHAEFSNRGARLVCGPRVRNKADGRAVLNM